mmetsp:Transcript_62433/g.176079  ORF Transcript_62433/g.176079 Transcript_62433/m.176079 type:complete len:251 (+) Transcript_62433:927-1679(+)
MPVLSIRRCSNRRSSARALTLLTRSSRRVQQMQPLLSSTSLSLLSSSFTPSVRSFASMLTEAMSLTKTATRMPSRLFSTCVSRVVLPAPRKPLSTVTGSFSSSAPPPPPADSAASAAGPPNISTNSSFSCAETRSTVTRKRWFVSLPVSAEYGARWRQGLAAELLPPLMRTASPTEAGMSSVTTVRFQALNRSVLASISSSSSGAPSADVSTVASGGPRSYAPQSTAWLGASTVPSPTRAATSRRFTKSS